MEEVVLEAWWVPMLGTILTAILGIIGAYVTKFVRKMSVSMDLNAGNKEALEALLEGMAKAQDDLVRDMKRASKDKKLTKAEIEQVKQYAWNHARGIATGPAKDIIMQWSGEKVSSLIKQLLAKYTK